MAEQQSNEELFRKVCHLYCLSRFREAREMFYEAAQIPSEMKSFAQSAKINQYISDHNPELSFIIEADKAFTEMGNMFQNATSLTADDVAQNIKAFENVLPLMNEEDALRVKYWHTRLYSYPDLVDETPRMQVLADLINSCPLDNAYTNKMMQECARQVNYLDVSVLDKYEIIKKAQLKSSNDVRGTYAQMLDPLADVYFNKMLQLADSDQETYEMRQQYYDKALKAVKDIDIPREVKLANAEMPAKISMLRQNMQHKRSLLVLGRLKKLHKTNGRQDRAAQVHQRMNNLCYAFYKKFPQLKSKKEFAL